ncbi:unnamed protein product [Closterium sp. Naga37s-1]|nr:unnamed protein product [Closterium sp. Naga37s-1]
MVAYPFVVRSADVTIRSVTLERDFLGMNAFGVEVYMECVNDNVKITLPGVATKGVAVNYTGQEAWQPVMKLNPGECKRCTVYQKKKAFNVTSWMADAPTTEEGNYDVTMYVAIGATLLSVGVVLFVGIIVFYFWRRAKVAQKEADMYRDQAEKSLERGASDGGDLPVSGEARV